MLHEGKQILRTAEIKDLFLDSKGWVLVLVEGKNGDALWRAVKKNGTVTFYHDDYFECIIEAVIVQKRYCND